jgi:hypothetical protein
MSIQKTGAGKTLLDIQHNVLKSAKDALVKISNENPFETERYTSIPMLKGLPSGKRKVILTDSGENSYVCFAEDGNLWIPESIEPAKKTKVTLTFGEKQIEFSCSELRNKNPRYYFNPHKKVPDIPVSKNVSNAIKNFLGQVAENPSQQKPISASPDCRHGIKLLNAGFSAEDHFWFVPESPELVKETMYAAFNLYEIQKQIDALHQWRKRTPKTGIQLMKFFEPWQITGEYLRDKPSVISEEEEINWLVLTDPGREGAIEQHNFVRKALATPDVALLEGPPGSGKTTVILELILQLFLRGKRVLLSSATHVAIDNLLERIHEIQVRRNSNLGILALRIASDVNSMSDVVRENFHDARIMEKARRKTESLLSTVQDKTTGQKMLLNPEGKLDENEFRHFILNNANLVAGTLVGLLQHEGFKTRQPDFEAFDYLIVDEASKVTLSGFLVPALWAKRWVLVGDTKQLAPYSDSALVETILTGEKNISLEEAEKLTQLIGDAFAYRQDENEGKKRVAKLRKYEEEFSDHQIEDLHRLSQTFFPSVFELFQNGLPDWLITNDSKFGLFKGLPNVLSNTPDTESDQMWFEDDQADDKPWKNRFQSLTYQHRMVDELAAIPRKFIYGGNNMFTSKKANNPKTPLLNLLGEKDDSACTWINVMENGNSGNGNSEELKLVLKALDAIEDIIEMNPSGRKIEIAVITFYRAQERHLNKKIKERKERKGSAVLLKTVDSIQGQEADIVLLCFTTWGKNRFYNVPNRLNVALTRSKQRLLLFGNPEAIHGYTDSPALMALCSNIKNQTI